MFRTRNTINSVGGGEGGMRSGGTFQGRHFKIKKIRPVYGHLNALQLSISVHQRCSVTFKMHQIHLRPGRRSICTLLWGTFHTPYSRLKPRARRGGRTKVCPGRLAQTLTPPLTIKHTLRHSYDPHYALAAYTGCS